MRELVEIDAYAEHACGQPSVERWQVLEPITGRWTWMRVFGCCNQVVVDAEDDEDLQAQRAA
jgi:hypothetical protein